MFFGLLFGYMVYFHVIDSYKYMLTFTLSNVNIAEYAARTGYKCALLKGFVSVRKIGATEVGEFKR